MVNAEFRGKAHMFAQFVKKPAATESEINAFLSEVDFLLPDGLLDFYRETNGADITDENGNYFVIWPIHELIENNRLYRSDEFTPGFFIFGTDGGSDSFVIDKSNGYIYDFPLDTTDFNDTTFLDRTVDEFFASGGSPKL